MILVCGGAGYIGAHMVRELRQSGHEVLVFDDLSTGHVQAVAGVPLIQGTLLSVADLDLAFSGREIKAVVHFAAKALVGESMRDPLDYYENNVVGTLYLLQAMRRHRVDKLVFSSSCATYGHPLTERIAETHSQQPINPYGASKLMCERLLADAAVAYGLRSVALRYFNAAGAADDGALGESHHPETHLIPNAIAAATDPQRWLTIMGDDYPTADGTCIRDYVHVSDLVDAHMRALRWMDNEAGAHAFNLGTEHGVSVNEIITAVESVTGAKVKSHIGPRREGDPPVLVADSTLARGKLGWQPSHSSIDQIIGSAVRWHAHARF